MMLNKLIIEIIKRVMLKNDNKIYENNSLKEIKLLEFNLEAKLTVNNYIISFINGVAVAFSFITCNCCGLFN